MKDIVGIRFKKPGKIYYFDPGNLKLQVNDKVIVDTAGGEEYATVSIPNKQMPEEKIVAPLRKVIRKANYKDDKIYESNQKKQKEAFEIALEKIKKHNLDMKLINVEYKFDNSKILFYFTADGRIDFRELVKDLAAVFKTRIELRQIGVRDEVRRIGGQGACGRELCCCSFLNNFDAVSIKMAKEQNLSLNPSKISGACGRLMCCLKYEQNAYDEKLERLPRVGAIVKTADGEGMVDSVEILKEKVRVKFKDGEGHLYKKYDAKDVKIIKNVEREEYNQEEKENAKELEQLEKLEEMEEKNNKDDEMI